MLQQSFERVLKDSSPEIRQLVGELLAPEASHIATLFYQELLDHPEANTYISQEQVASHLEQSFTQWFVRLFTQLDCFNPVTLDEQHQRIGTVHARIGIPMQLVDQAMQIVKDACFRSFLAHDMNHEQVSQGIIYINNLLDTALTGINSAFFHESIKFERDALALRMHSSADDIVLECERIRSEIFDWNRSVLTKLLTLNSDEAMKSMPECNVYQTTFGLWFVHKANFYFPDFEELQSILGLLKNIDTLFSSSPCDRQRLPDQLNEMTSRISSLLTAMIQKVFKDMAGRDPLTKLLNRRFLDGILKRETSISIQRGQRFGILMVDIDHFKQVNDNYGHQAGDTVLERIADVIQRCLRPTDFCFRYGGEEILILL